MQARTEAIMALSLLGAVSALSIVVHIASAPVSYDPSPSTYNAGPYGTMALFEAVERLGIDTRRWRGRFDNLQRVDPVPSQLIAVIGPDDAPSTPELRALMAHAGRAGHGADLLIAGASAEKLMRCFGYRTNLHVLDSVVLLESVAHGVKSGATLERVNAAVYQDSSRMFDVAPFRCVVPQSRPVNILLSSARGPVAVRIDSAVGSNAVILIADANLLRNRTLRDSDLGVWILSLLQGHRQILFDEYHHGYGAAGSLAGETVRWTLHSPWGWALAQLCVVGVLALLVSGIRFGPIRPGIVRIRRSPLEHVHALATALQSAQGHDEAVGAMVRGLRRRLMPPLMRTRGDWRSWLQQLTSRVQSPSQRAALQRLQQLAIAPSSDSVQRAANAVEDLWEALK